MATNILKKIHTRVKQLRKEHPKMTYQDAMKKAGKEISGIKQRKVTGVKKPAKIVKVGNISAVRRKPASTLYSNAQMILKKIDKMEADLKKAKSREERDLLKIFINGEHDKLDLIKKQVKYESRKKVS